MKKAPFSALLLAAALSALSGGAAPAQNSPAASAAPSGTDPLAWPPVTKDTRPWTRWWWMGSAVDKDDLAKELARYREAGLGGVEITPIYGVKGREKEFIDYLSPKWMEMMQHSVTTAKGLDMGVDMANGTGWCFGGPNVPDSDANASVVWKTYEVKAGEKLNEKFDKAATQTLMAYPTGGKWLGGIGGHVGTQSHPAEGSGSTDITDKVGPDSTRSVRVQGVGNAPIDITDKIGPDGLVDWTAPDAVGGACTVYAISQKPSGVKVKRPAPGGAGPMLNLLYGSAMDRYLKRFSEAFDTAGKDAPKPNAVFHDSYEYKSDWSPDFFAQFEKRRGYKLQNELPALFGKEQNDHVARVKSDFRETVSDIQAEESIPAWTKWAHEHGFVTREQAHGSPGNWLDIYAAADIPETEMFYNDRDILVSKFASSAAHVTGKNLVGSESCTWAAEHFTEKLSDLKAVVDDLFLSGVNRVTFHGTAYSPDDAAWPGWCFYASTELNPRNALWHDVPALTSYITRVQSVLQAGKSDNDVLLYWPIYDTWHNARGMVQQFTIHGRDWLHDQPVGKAAEWLEKNGYLFDYISDRQLAMAKAAGGGIELAGKRYSVIVVPKCEHMPLETLKHLSALAESGATIIFEGPLPTSTPGMGRSAGETQFQNLVRAINQVRTANPGRVLIGELSNHLGSTSVRPEPLADNTGLRMIRRAVEGGKYYFLVNGDKPIDGWVMLGAGAEAAAIMDPVSGQAKLARFSPETQGEKVFASGSTMGAIKVAYPSKIYLQLEPHQSIILHTFGNGSGSSAVKSANSSLWNYYQPDGQPTELKGAWSVKFINGGPDLPPPAQTEQLASWTKFGGEPAQAFAGTALYTLNFDAPAQPAAHYSLDLGSVCQSARVKLNGKDLGTVFVKPYRVPVENLKPQGNVLEVEVTGTSANRIRDLDVRKVPWKIFYDTNIVTLNYRPFDASGWPIADQGLLGPVMLQPEKEVAVAQQ